MQANNTLIETGNLRRAYRTNTGSVGTDIRYKRRKPLMEQGHQEMGSRPWLVGSKTRRKNAD